MTLVMTQTPTLIAIIEKRDIIRLDLAVTV